ncbi:erythromycin esterase family protein [Halolamina sp. CBA1230]|uniref:erythromycin esterase family protein n=1 Tax=Halolamina sp. CBA1230 TaxID=1853690 RepID=UPI0009A23927|nr:erythromycin esterase family protein [Halolamina sp. CBA1230]QKY19967.1 erythromycin esterase family protein [Halolamina sp. CBA1230]
MTNDTTDTTSTAQSDKPVTTPAVRAGLRAHAHELGTCDPTIDLAPDALPAGIDDAAVVALGEGTHGTREFFRLKHRLLRWLVTEAGVRTFAMEANAPEARALDEYVVHGRGDPETGLAGLYFWTWQIEAVLALVEWLRRFNEGRPLDDRVRFRGFDAQYTQGAVDALLAQSGDELSPDAEADLELIGDDGTRPVQDDRARERIDAAARVVPRVRETLGNGDRAHWLDVIEQATAYKRTLLDWADADDGSDAESAAMADVLRVRDRAMAENVEWIEQRADGPVALWAHDAHANRDRHAVRGSAVAAPSMGSHLAERYSDDYYAVGLAFARGSFQAVDATGEGRGLTSFTLRDPLPGTVESAIDGAGIGTAMLDIRGASEDPRLTDWLSARRERFSVGATYDGDPEGYLTGYSLSEAFDALCFVPETTRARPLSD